MFFLCGVPFPRRDDLERLKVFRHVCVHRRLPRFVSLNRP